jgi:hypothetical protein
VETLKNGSFVKLDGLLSRIRRAGLCPTSGLPERCCVRPMTLGVQILGRWLRPVNMAHDVGPMTYVVDEFAFPKAKSPPQWLQH